jgi:hypothetical protein
MSFKLCNDTYDFSKLLGVVNSNAIEAIFNKFGFNQVTRQSSTFLGFLKLTCDVSPNFSNFYKEFIDFLKIEHLSKIL